MVYELPDPTNIVVRGNEFTRWGDVQTDYISLGNLKHGEHLWLWRGYRMPRRIVTGDKVYFYRRGCIVGYCYFDGFAQRTVNNKFDDLVTLTGFLLTGPFHEYADPFQVGMYRGYWRWCYVWFSLQKWLDDRN